MYDAPNILVCQQDPFNYTAINQQGYEYYKDFMTGTLELNKSVVTWAGRDNLTYSQIIDKIYRSVDIDKIKIYFDWYKGSTPSSVASRLTFTTQIGKCIEFLPPNNLAKRNQLTIEVPQAESFIVYLTDPNWAIYTQGRKFMSCCHRQELGQQASWLLIGCTRVNNQSEARTAS